HPPPCPPPPPPPPPAAAPDRSPQCAQRRHDRQRHAPMHGSTVAHKPAERQDGRNRNVRPSDKPAVAHPDIPIVAEVRELIVSARKTVATAVNASLTLLYWRIG